MMKLKIRTSSDFDATERDVKLFEKPKGGAGRFVYRHGKLVPKHSVNNIEDIDDKRSDLPSPMIAPRFPEHRNMATGQWVDDRRHHREILKRHGLTEVGNEKMPSKDKGPSRADIAADIKESIEQLKQGYEFPPEDSYEAADEVSFESVDVDVSKPDAPQYVRSNSTTD